MNKNVLIVVGVILLIAIAGLWIREISILTPISASEQDEAELSAIAVDLETFSADNIAIEETAQGFSDILDEGAGISASKTLDEPSIAQEFLQADLSDTLNDFETDETAMKELDQIFGEILR